MEEEAIQMAYDHLTAVGRAVSTTDAVTVVPTNETASDDNILRTLIHNLRYFPRKYSRDTLACYASMILGSAELVRIPAHTFVKIAMDHHNYIYMTEIMKPVFDEMPSLSHQNLGDLAFITQHLRTHLSPEKYNFFFL
jgi:hypothetical protein